MTRSRLKIRSNYHSRPFLSRYDVPDDILAAEFDYQDPDETVDGFILYGDVWYHLDQFTALCNPTGPLQDWDGYIAESMSTGVVLSICLDGDHYQIGSYRTVGE